MNLPIEQHNLNRVTEDLNIANRAGFKLRRTIYPLGMNVLPIGMENYKASRKEYEELALVDEVYNQIKTIIDLEERQDIEHSLPELFMGISGFLGTMQDSTYFLAPTDWALKQLIERCRNTGENTDAVTKAATYASDPECPIHFMKDITNHYLASAYDKHKKPIETVLRTRKLPATEDGPLSNNYRQLFATVSYRYNRDCDTDSLAAMVAKKINESTVPAKAEGVYDGSRFRMSVLYHSDVETPVVGELFKAGVIIESADDGSRSISITPMVIRNLCLNLIILDKSTQRISLTHLRTELYDNVSNAMDTALTKVNEFAVRWGAASKEKILDNLYIHTDPEIVFNQLMKMGHIKLHGSSRAEMLSRLVSAWQMEPGYTKDKIINAVSRAAHENTWKSPWIVSDLEEEAGKMLYNKVYLDLSS